MDSKVGKAVIDFNPGDHVILVDDDWSGAAHDIIIVDVEPVPGSTQCVIQANGEKRVVSRGELRPAALLH